MANYIHKTGATKTRFQETPKYDEGLVDLGNNLYTWLVPNGSWGESNSGLIVGDGESLLVDTLWDVKFTQAMLDAMKSITDNSPIRYVVNTHADGDHFWGNQLVADAELITTQASYEEMLTTQTKSMFILKRLGKVLSTVKILGADKVGHWFKGMVKPYTFEDVIHTPATNTFTGTKTLSVGGRTIELIEVGPAHTHGDLMVHIPDAKAIFTADILFIGSTPVMWAGPVENWLSALDKILAMDVDIIVPGHGPLTDKAGIQKVRDYWGYVRVEVEKRFKMGMSEQKAATDIVLSESFKASEFSQWNSPERMMVNTHTMYRHLNGRKRDPSVLELANILRKQALLAHKLPQAQPTVMRLPR